MCSFYIDLITFRISALIPSLMFSFKCVFSFFSPFPIPTSWATQFTQRPFFCRVMLCLCFASRWCRHVYVAEFYLCVNLRSSEFWLSSYNSDCSHYLMSTINHFLSIIPPSLSAVLICFCLNTLHIFCFVWVSKVFTSSYNTLHLNNIILSLKAPLFWECEWLGRQEGIIHLLQTNLPADPHSFWFFFVISFGLVLHILSFFNNVCVVRSFRRPQPPPH